LASREETEGSFTRELVLDASVSDPEIWIPQRDLLVRLLRFLSGDNWELKFSQAVVQEVVDIDDESDDIDSVCLLSGGLDSLVGAIDLLAAGARTVFVGHHDSPKAENRQNALAPRLDAAYPELSSRRPLYLRPAEPGTTHPHLLPGIAEITTRSRSFLFVAAAIAVATAHGAGVPVYMAENGHIGINVPLTKSRGGANSTRTTHPHYVNLYQQLLTGLGLAHQITNPYRLATKGELPEACGDPDLLAELADETVSCSHPEVGRWGDLPQTNCGYCYPCLVRQAALHEFGQSGGTYARDVLSDKALLLTEGRGADLRAVTTMLSIDPRPTDVLRSGPIPHGEAPAFYAMYLRARAELGRWLRDGANDEILARLR
jgi:7-cyano-7-deazaguanine synthase in queuosine biosynthesis